MLQAYRLNVNRSDGYLVWIEVDRSGPEPRVADVSLEILSKIREMNDGSRVWGAVFGFTELKALHDEIFSYGVETLYEVHDRRLCDFQPEVYADSLSKLIVRTEPAVVLMGATPRGRELAPRVAARLDTGLTADCTGLSMDDRDLTMVRPAFGGNLLATIRVTTFPQMATVRPGVFPKGRPSEDARGTVIYWQADCSLLKEIVSSEKVAREPDEITKARVLLSLGAGVKKESIPVAESVAKKLGGAVSCSRKLVDRGWFPQSRQVGQSGRGVAPDVYIAFGISGAVQHLAGISSAKRIISVNTDPDARINDVADEIIVADADDVLRELDKIL